MTGKGQKIRAKTIQRIKQPAKSFRYYPHYLQLTVFSADEISQTVLNDASGQLSSYGGFGFSSLHTV